jgi:hypothetical protein
VGPARLLRVSKDTHDVAVSAPWPMVQSEHQGH